MLQILIENSENIGILPPHIVQSISTETSGSTDNGLDSFELHLKHKKKKHRSGSLTRKLYLSSFNFYLTEVRPDENAFLKLDLLQKIALCAY